MCQREKAGESVDVVAVVDFCSNRVFAQEKCPGGL